MTRPHSQLNRRSLLSLFRLATFASSAYGFARNSRPKNLLLRSSWQTVNIGDIAHTPGVLRILETHLPDVEVTLWPSQVDNGVEELLRSRFPQLKIAASGSNELKRAFENCDFLLHGSGASLVAERDVIRWREETGKPYGVYGITLPPTKSSSTVATSTEAMDRTIDALSGARFVFFRDSKSLSLAKQLGCQAEVMEFGPDGAFACDLRDDEKASVFSREQWPGSGQVSLLHSATSLHSVLDDQERTF